MCRINTPFPFLTNKRQVYYFVQTQPHTTQFIIEKELVHAFMGTTGRDFVNIVLRSSDAAAFLQEARCVHSTDTPYSARIVFRVATASGRGIVGAAFVVLSTVEMKLAGRELSELSISLPSHTEL